METNIISQDALELIDAIEKYKKASGKVDYKLELDEYVRLKQETETLLRHLDLIEDYEIKKRGK